MTAPMQRRDWLAGALALGALPWARPARAAPAQPGQAVVWPDVALLDGSRLGPAQTAGRAMVVVFWSTTCPFCRRHNQHVEKLHRASAGRGLVVLGVARDRDAAAVRRYALKQGYSFPITMEHAAMAAALASRQVIPLTATITPDGRLKELIPGEMFEEDVLALQALSTRESR